MRKNGGAVVAFLELGKVNIVFACLSVVVSLATLLALPRTDKRCAMSRLALFGLTNLAIFVAAHPAIILVFWSLSLLLIIAQNDQGRWRLNWRGHSALLCYQIVALLAFLGGMMYAQAGEVSVVAGYLFAIAGMARQGIFPFHSFVPEVYRNGAWSTLLGYFNAPVGVFLLIQYALPHLKFQIATDDTMLTTVLTTSACYFAAMALVQQSLRSVFAWISLAQLSLILVHVVAGSEVADVGAYLQLASGWLALTGLGVLVWSLEERVGAGPFSVVGGGMATSMPTLAAMFLIFGLAVASMPATLGFISEDLLLHAVFEESFFSTFMVLGVTCLAGIALYRAYMLTFLGEARNPASLRDLRLGQRVVLGLLLGALVFSGIFPQLVIH